MKRIRSGGQHKSYFRDNEALLNEYGINYDGFTKLTDNVEAELKNVLNKLDSKEQFFLSYRKSGGVKGNNDLRNLLWWNVDINSEWLIDKYKDYGHLLFSTDRAIINNLGDVSKGNGKPFPQVDIKTGNIHVEFNLFKWVADYKDKPSQAIQQIVMVDADRPDPGPKLREGLYNEFKADELVYKWDDIRVPKNCYYPQLFDNKDYDNSIEHMLKGLLVNVLGENKFKELNFD